MLVFKLLMAARLTTINYESETQSQGGVPVSDYEYLRTYWCFDLKS